MFDCFLQGLAERQPAIGFEGEGNRDGHAAGIGCSHDAYGFLHIIDGEAGNHVGFGAGIHMCVGQLLARLEGEVLLAALAHRVRAVEITGTPVRRYNNTLRGLASLPLTLHAA